AIRRLVYNKDDIVLIIATKYSKSTILYSFSTFIELIIVQIIPLTKLGEN
ncbi:uncharacterized protein THITE_35400, partial [Thermothielavioides terrestris NRRL 8126]